MTSIDAVTKLGDKLRELAALADRDNLAGIAFVQVGDWGRQVSVSHSSDSEKDAKALVSSLYQVARVYTVRADRASAPSTEVIQQRILAMNIGYHRDRIRPRFAEMCALKAWHIPITELHLNMTFDAILIGDAMLVTIEELHNNISTSEIYARMEKICAERVEQSV